MVRNGCLKIDTVGIELMCNFRFKRRKTLRHPPLCMRERRKRDAEIHDPEKIRKIVIRDDAPALEIVHDKVSVEKEGAEKRSSEARGNCARIGKE